MIEDRHHAVTAKFIDISPVLVYQRYLLFELCAQVPEKFSRLHLFSKRGEAANIGEKNCEFALFRRGRRARLH